MQNTPRTTVELTRMNPDDNERLGPSHFFDINPVVDGYKVTTPGLYSDVGAVGTSARVVASRAEADAIIADAKARHVPHTELASLQRSFSSSHAIGRQSDGTFAVTTPGLYSIDQSELSVGTTERQFADWASAKDYYLQKRNERSYPESALFQFTGNGATHRYMALEQFGRRPHLSDKPRPISEHLKRSLDFDMRNDAQYPSAATYHKTVERPGWSSQIFSFVEDYAQTTEGIKMTESLGVADLRLLTPQQAVSLTLELVTRLKKYSLHDMDAMQGNTEADQNSVLYLLNQGLRNRDNDDFKGNGVCRNFASAVKAVFESIKDNQTTFNYLQNTYAFYEDAESHIDFNPSYKAQGITSSISMHFDEPTNGHAWNSFVTIEENGASQTVVDATWSKIDYDTDKAVQLDYTVQRIERDVYRNGKAENTGIDADNAASFYLFLIDSLPQQEGLVLDAEASARIRSTDFYAEQVGRLKEQHPGLPSEQYDMYALKVYKHIADTQGLTDKTRFYTARALEVLRGKEAAVSESTANELVRLAAEVKPDVTYHELDTLFALPATNTADKQVVVQKYVRAWESASTKSYLPVGDLIFRNGGLQQFILAACSSRTRAKVETLLSQRIKQSP